MVNVCKDKGTKTNLHLLDESTEAISSEYGSEMSNLQAS